MINAWCMKQPELGSQPGGPGHAVPGRLQLPN